MSDATSNEKPRSLERWMAAALDAQMTASGLKDALQRAGFRIAELEAQRDEARAAYLRLCRDLAMHTKGWGAVPGGSPREAAEVEVRIKAAQALGASDEAVNNNTEEN